MTVSELTQRFENIFGDSLSVAEISRIQEACLDLIADWRLMQGELRRGIIGAHHSERILGQLKLKP